MYTLYNYKELSEKVRKDRTNKENRLNLYRWFEEYGDCYWNGWSYAFEDGERLYPKYEIDKNGNFNLIDVIIRI